MMTNQAQGVIMQTYHALLRTAQFLKLPNPIKHQYVWQAGWHKLETVTTRNSSVQNECKQALCCRSWRCNAKHRSWSWF